MASVAALVPDLLFGSRAVEVLRAGGHDARLVGEVAATAGAEVVVVDLASDPDGGIAALTALTGTPVVAVYSHVDDATRTRALDAGAALCVPRSRFVREGAALVDRVAQGKA